MIGFEKVGSQSTKGWDAKTLTQVLKIGDDAEISLRGSGPKGEILELAVLDPSICTFHERPAVGAQHVRRFVISALKKGKCAIFAKFPKAYGGVVAGLMYVDVTASKNGIRLVFFPGERSVNYGAKKSATVGMIYVVRGNGERFSAAGGPKVGRTDPKQGGHTYDPTPAGRYLLGPKQHVTTSTWIKSVVPWDATIRINKDGEAEWKGDTGGWRLASGPNGDVTAAAISYLRKSGDNHIREQIIAGVRAIFIDAVTGKQKITIWKLNDFGKWGWNLRTLNGAQTAYYIHTTPDDEEAEAAKEAVRLTNSHGCVHLVPSQRDQMIAKGYLQEGVEFDVRSYDEVGPP
jgi:L,D-transpeptidase catalytic domain